MSAKSDHPLVTLIYFGISFTRAFYISPAFLRTPGFRPVQYFSCQQADSGDEDTTAGQRALSVSSLSSTQMTTRDAAASL